MKSQAREAVRNRIELPAILPVLLLVLTGGPADAHAAQNSRPVASHPNGLARTVRCTKFDDDSPYPFEYERTLDLAIQAVYVGRAEQEKSNRMCFYVLAEALARHLVFENPNDPESRYWYAAALALRASDEGGGTQVRLAQSAQEQARLVLTVAPDHAGAMHLLGMLHAGVMRLSGFKRFVATKMLGGDVLSEASWETAESLLAQAATLQPEVLDHHYQLGALYMDTDRPESALAAFERVLGCRSAGSVDRDVRVRAEAMVWKLRRELGSQAANGAP